MSLHHKHLFSNVYIVTVVRCVVAAYGSHHVPPP